MRRAASIAIAVALFVVLLVSDRLGLELSDAQRVVAAVTALTATLWLTAAIPIGAASVLPALLFPLFGVLEWPAALGAHVRDLVLLFLGAFIVALGLERWGVHRRIALFIVDRVGSSKRRLVLGFMAASAFLSMWINNTATTLMMLPIVTAVLLRDGGGAPGGARASTPLAVDADRHHQRFGWCLLLGVAYSASVGGMATPVGTAPNQEFLGQFDVLFPSGPKLSFADWVIAFAPITILFVPLGWLVLTRVVYSFADPADEAQRARAAVREERRSAGPMRTPEVRMALAFLATALLWVFRADIRLGEFVIPGWTRLFYGAEAGDPAWYAQHKNDISDATVALCMAFFLFVCPSGERREPLHEAGREASIPRRRTLMDLRTARKLPWEVLLLLGGGFCLALAFKESQLDVAIGGALAPLLEGQPSWLVVLAIALVVSLLTEVTSNTATTAVLLPVVAAAAATAGQHPMLVMLPATLAASAAFMMPAATPPNAVVFATGKLPISRMARAGIVLNVMTVILISLVFELWSSRWLDVCTPDGGLPDWAK